MSTVTNNENTDSQQTTTYNTAKIFLGDNAYETGFHNNAGYADVALVAGQVMGRVTLTDEIIPTIADATDGSQFPIGVMSHDITVEPGITQTITLCTKGRVDGDLLVFDAGDTKETVVDGRRLKDLLTMIGFELLYGTEMTSQDNI